MNDLQQTARQTKALAKKRKNSRSARKRRLTKTKPYQRGALPSPERVRARAKTDRFEVDEARSWLVVRSEPTRAARCAQEIRARGYPVFEARQEERLVAENGKARVAQVPVLRRLMFVGMAEGESVGALADTIGLDAVWSRGEDELVWTGQDWLGGCCPVRIGPLAMQKFADHLTGHRRDDKLVADLVKMLFAVGDAVTFTSATLLGVLGRVEQVDPGRGRYRVRSELFKQSTLVEATEDQLEAA